MLLAIILLGLQQGLFHLFPLPAQISMMGLGLAHIGEAQLSGQCRHLPGHSLPLGLGLGQLRACFFPFPDQLIPLLDAVLYFSFQDFLLPHLFFPLLHHLLQLTKSLFFLLQTPQDHLFGIQ